MSFLFIERAVVILTAISLLGSLLAALARQKEKIDILLDMQKDGLNDVKGSIRLLRRDAYLSAEKLQDDINNIEGFLSSNKAEKGYYIRNNSEVKAQNFLKSL